MKLTSAVRVGAVLLALAISPALSGCTLVGLAVGAAIPRYEDARSLAEVEPRQRVELTSLPVVEPVREAAAPTGPPARPESVVTRGRFAGIENGWVRLDSSEGAQKQVRADLVEHVRVKNGSYWGAGVAVGLLVDLATVVVVTTQIRGPR